MQNVQQHSVHVPSAHRCSMFAFDARAHETGTLDCDLLLWQGKRSDPLLMSLCQRRTCQHLRPLALAASQKRAPPRRCCVCFCVRDRIPPDHRCRISRRCALQWLEGRSTMAGGAPCRCGRKGCAARCLRGCRPVVMATGAVSLSPALKGMLWPVGVVRAAKATASARCCVHERVACHDHAMATGAVLHTADACGTPYVPVPRTLAFALPALHVTSFKTSELAKS